MLRRLCKVISFPLAAIVGLPFAVIIGSIIYIFNPKYHPDYFMEMYSKWLRS